VDISPRLAKGPVSKHMDREVPLFPSAAVTAPAQEQ